MICFVIRADDIGYSRAVNYGILDAVEGGIVKSAGLMVNMPEAQHGFDLLKYKDVCIGQHTNLCLGTPCSDPEDIPSLVDENGQFLSSRYYRKLAKEGKDPADLDDAVKEVKAQYRRFKEITGREPAYFEAHAIASDNLWNALAIVADEYDLPFCHMLPGDQNATFRGKPVHACPMGSMDPDYDAYAFLKETVLSAEDETEPYIYVTHPGYLDAYLLNHSSLTVNRTKEVKMLRDPEVKKWLEERVKLVSYEEI